MAETYHIYDMKSLPFQLVATLCAGLGKNSRTMMAVNKQKATLEETLIAGILDTLNILAWSRTKDAESGNNRPNSILGLLIGEKEEKVNDKPEGFATIEDFERARLEILGGLNG